MVTVYAKVKENENTEIKNKARAIVELANVESNEVMNWKGMIKIYKAITNFYPEYGTPFFNFEIKDSAGNVWHRHVELSNFKQSDSAEIFFVPTGIAETGGSFSIRELRNARYELSAAIGRTNMAVANNVGATTISKENPLGEIRFVNEINKWNKITHAASAVNTFDLVEQPDPEDLTVTITGNTATKTYNGSEQSVTGYTISIPEGATLTASEIVGPTQASAIARGTVADGGSNPDGSYPMGLTADDFSTENSDYNVTFDVVDGWLKIVPAELYDITGTWYDAYCYSITFNNDGTYELSDRVAGYNDEGTYTQTEDTITLESSTGGQKAITYSIIEYEEGTQDDELDFISEGIYLTRQEGYCSICIDHTPYRTADYTYEDDYRIETYCNIYDYENATVTVKRNGVLEVEPFDENLLNVQYEDGWGSGYYNNIYVATVPDAFANVTVVEQDYSSADYLVVPYEDTAADFGTDLYYDSEHTELVDPQTQFESGMMYTFYR